MNFRIFHNHQHPASRTSFISPFFILYYTEKKGLHKSASFFEVSVALTLGLVIPVYCRQTGFSSASINFYEKPMVETEPTVCKDNMAAKVAKGPGKEIVRKRLTILCLVLFLYTKISMIHASISQLLSSLSHRDRYFLTFFAPVR